MPEDDFTALETGHSGRQGEGDGTYDHPCAGTFKTADGGRNIYPFRRRRRFPKVLEFASEDEPGPGLAPRESIWSISRKFSRIRFQLGRHKRARKRGFRRAKRRGAKKSRRWNSPRNPE